MLLILTNSIDATTDELVRRIGVGHVFRFNVDLWRDYEIQVDPSGFRIADPTGRSCASADIRAAYVRKPTFDDLIDTPAGGCLEAWLRAQISCLTQEVYNWCQQAGVVRLVEKGAQQRFGKFAQMWTAQKHFSVPDWRFTKTKHPPLEFPGKSVISKALVADFVQDYRFYYTTRVEPGKLDISYPWLLQVEIEADSDLTVVYVSGKCFGFVLDRRLFEGVDWRKNINRRVLPWAAFPLSAEIQGRIHQFMQESSLDFGRLDFLIQGDKFLFLEVNPNGQWAWLDMDGSKGIFDAVVQELCRGWRE